MLGETIQEEQKGEQLKELMSVVPYKEVICEIIRRVVNNMQDCDTEVFYHELHDRRTTIGKLFTASYDELITNEHAKRNTRIKG